MGFTSRACYALLRQNAAVSGLLRPKSIVGGSSRPLSVEQQRPAACVTAEKAAFFEQPVHNRL